MKKSVILVMAACFFFSATLAGGACAPGKKTVNKSDMLHLTLKAAPQNAGAMGKAVFVPTGKNCQVNLTFGGLSRLISRPVRIQTYIYAGSCGSLGEKPVYDLNKTKKTYNNGNDVWEVSKAIPVPLSTLMEGDYAIVIRGAGPDGNLELFCGDIR